MNSIVFYRKQWSKHLTRTKDMCPKLSNLENWHISPPCDLKSTYKSNRYLSKFNIKFRFQASYRSCGSDRLVVRNEYNTFKFNLPLIFCGVRICNNEVTELQKSISSLKLFIQSYPSIKVLILSKIYFQLLDLFLIVRIKQTVLYCTFK